MLCEKCKVKEACYHSTLIINGNEKSTNLCADCAKKEGLMEEHENFFKNFFNEFDNIFNSRLDDFFCPSCNLGFNQFKNRGFIGCPDCFDIFKKDLEGVKEEITFNTPKKSKNQEEIEKLEELKQKAIKEERYEDAEMYNKKIKSLKDKD